jgi:hypothetical protein
MSIQGAQRVITTAVCAWDGIEAQPHHILPDSGWITLRIRRTGDVARAIDLLRRSYELAKRQKRPQSTNA